MQTGNALHRVRIPLGYGRAYINNRKRLQTTHTWISAFFAAFAPTPQISKMSTVASCASVQVVQKAKPVICSHSAMQHTQNIIKYAIPALETCWGKKIC
jgi:hypothetical protein